MEKKKEPDSLQKVCDEVLTVFEKNQLNTIEVVFLLEDLKRIVLANRDYRAMQLMQKEREKNGKKEYPRGIA